MGGNGSKVLVWRLSSKGVHKYKNIVKAASSCWCVMHLGLCGEKSESCNIISLEIVIGSCRCSGFVGDRELKWDEIGKWKEIVEI